MKSLGVTLASNGDYWQASWSDTTGKRRKKSLGPKASIPKRQALGLCRELAAQHLVRPGARDVGRAPTLRAWLDELATLRTDHADTTRALHDLTGTYLCAVYGAETGLDRINRAAAARFRPWLAASNLSEASISGHMSRARQIFGRAMRLDLIQFNPFDREDCSCPHLDHDWRYVSEAELELLLDAAPDIDWRCLLALCRLAGLRRGEAMALTWDRIDWARHVLHVRPRRRKATTKERARTVPITPRLYNLLLEAREQAGADPRVAPVGVNNIERTCVKIIERAGLTPWPKPLHTLRKNLVTDWQAKHPPLDVASWLGHDIRVAAEHYHQTRPETMAAVTGQILPVTV